MSDKTTHSGLRHGIDESSDELGKQIANDLPTTTAEVRSQLPADLTGLVAESVDKSNLSVQELFDESPLDQYLNDSHQDSDN